jgi:subtilisin family serine protease
VVARRVLIKFAAAPTPGELSASTLAAGSRPIPIGGAGWYKLDSSALDVPALMTKLAGLAGVAKVTPDYVLHLDGPPVVRRPAGRRRPSAQLPNDPDYSQQWAYDNTGQNVGGISGTPGADINAANAWGYATGNTLGVVADFDTGIDFNNPDLASNIWSAPQAYTITEGGAQYSCPQGSHGFSAVGYALGCNGQEADDNSHGTATAGIIGAVGNNLLGVTGVNWTTSIISIKVCEYTGQCVESEVVTGIDAALQIASHFGFRLVAGNISFTSSSDLTAIQDEMTLAGEQGVTFAAGTGDDGSSGAHYPAAFYLSNELAVSASDQFDLPARWTQSEYTSGGGDVAAPGKNALSTAKGDDGNNPILFAGTSASAPFVTGAIALIESACPLPPSAVKATIEGTADEISALSSIATYGRRLDLGNAIASCAAPGHTAGSGSVTVWLPGPTPDHSGTMTVTLLGYTYSYGYDTAVDDTSSVAEALAGQLSSNPYINAVYAGGGTISVTTKAVGPYTGYTMQTSVQDTCNPYYAPLTHGGGGCGSTPRISNVGIVAGN